MNNVQNINTSAQSLFTNGVRWLRADFHLHTRKDKEFQYDGEDNDFVKLYVGKLKQEKIDIGVITNHNKFDKDEFKALKKKAKHENIWLLPGVELSVNEGSNGIHFLIVFEENSWLHNEDYINSFLNAAFEGVPNRENENTRCLYNISQLFERLDMHRKAGRDSFIVLAHAQRNSGFFAELEGGRIQQIANTASFKSNVLAIQKIRTFSEIEKYNIWFNNKIPAFVEGSDCKRIEEIGKTQEYNGLTYKTYIKLGDFNFEALKYALIDYPHRVKKQPPTISHSFIKSIQFIGGKLDNHTIYFSPNLNSLIGIRGSGKSAIIEILRYTLGIQLTSSTADIEYKNNLISYILGSGGKVIVTIYNHKEHKEYRIEKIYGQTTNIYDNETGEYKNCSINAIFDTPVYFGQKDLSNNKEDFETDLLKRLVGDKLHDSVQQIKQQEIEVANLLSQLRQEDSLMNLKQETERSIRDTTQKLQYYKDNGVENKLKMQIQYEQDINNITLQYDKLNNFIKALCELLGDNAELFNPTTATSPNNIEIFHQANAILQILKQDFEQIKNHYQHSVSHLAAYQKVLQLLRDKKDAMAEEFAQIKRELNSDTLNPDTFIDLTRLQNTSQLKLQEINKQLAAQTIVKEKLLVSLDQLNNLWLNEYNLLKQEIAHINKSNSNLSIEVKFKGQKNGFYEHMKNTFRGTGLRDLTYQKIVETFNDYIEIYRQIDTLPGLIGSSNATLFIQRFNEQLKTCLTFRVKDEVTINYKGKPFKQHSLGQRASALLLFLLVHKESNVLIIDQPEDDLDNQTIYDEVIKEILEIKENMQFIFATHNANIPVLGDSEKVIVCSFDNADAISIEEGTIDTPTIQKSIVDIMEGGKDAFNKRKYIYNIWKE